MKYNKLTPFKWYVIENFPFIEADFDAITNYQLLSKVIEYLNKTINKTNELGLTVETFYKYFENLDVQDEIDNKIDEMINNGSFQEIITSYINLNSIIAFNTINDMKNSNNLINGSFAQTFGYENINDNGGALYKIRNITNSDIIDNQRIIKLNNSDVLIAELITKDNIINYKVFGNLENALNFAKQNTSYTIIVNDNLIINSSLELPANIKIKFNNITYTGENYAINIVDGLSGYIRFNNIVAENGGGINFVNKTNLIGRTHIKFNTIYSKNNSINFENTGGVLDSIIEGIVATSANGYSINIDSRGYVGQIEFKIIRLEANTNYAIHISSLNGGFTGANFGYCSLESSANGIKCEFGDGQSFESIYGTFRTMEVTGTILKLIGEITNVTADSFLKFDRVQYNKVDVSEVTYLTLSSRAFYIEGSICQNNGGNELASKGVIRRNVFIITEFPDQYQRATSNKGAWDGSSRPVSRYQVETSNAISITVPLWLSPESNKRFIISLTGTDTKNVTVNSPSGEWITDLSTQTTVWGDSFEVIATYNGSEISYILQKMGAMIRNITP